jgi:hypothetical protein
VSTLSGYRLHIGIHIGFIIFGGAALAVSGATPDEWVARLLELIKVPPEKEFLARISLSIVGFLFVVFGIIGSRRQPKLPSIVTEPRGMPQNSKPDPFADYTFTKLSGGDYSVEGRFQVGRYETFVPLPEFDATPDVRVFPADNRGPEDYKLDPTRDGFTATMPNSTQHGPWIFRAKGCLVSPPRAQN